MATLKIPGIVSPLVSTSTFAAPPVPLSYTMTGTIKGLANTGAALPICSTSNLNQDVPVLTAPMAVIYPSNFTTGSSVGYPI